MVLTCPYPHLHQRTTFPPLKHTFNMPRRSVGALGGAHPWEMLCSYAGHLQLDAGIQARCSKITPSMGCRNWGTGGRVEGGERGRRAERENEGARLVEEKECWEEGRGGGEVVTAHIY